MRLASAHFCDGVELLASVALDQVEVGPDLPVDLFPGDAVSLTDEGHEFFQIPVAVNHVLCPHLAVAVYEVRTLATGQNLSLLLREELVAVSALVQVVLLLLKQQLELLHEESAHNLVLALLENVKSVQADLLGHLSNNVGVDARHVHLDPADFFDVLPDEVEALLDKPVDLEELGWNQDRDCVLDVQLGPAVLHDGRVGEVLLVVLLGLVPADAVSNGSIEFVLFSLLLLVLLHREDVVEQPLENDGVAVD